MHQTILYKKISNKWHYVRLTADSVHTCLIEKGCVGALASDVENSALPTALSVEKGIQRIAQTWLDAGYGIPRRDEMQVLTLHYRVKPWQGYTCAAPWYEDWKTWYDEPMSEWLQNRGYTCFPDAGLAMMGEYLVVHKYVLEGDKASLAVQDIATIAPVVFQYKLFLSDQEKYPQVNYNPDVPAELNDIIRGLEEMATTMTSVSQELLLQNVIAQAPVREVNIGKRVSREKSSLLRKMLYEHWGFECDAWIPIGGESKQETVYIGQFPDALRDNILQIIKNTPSHASIYRLDYDDGISECSHKDILKPFLYEGVVFDASMTWIIYLSHHYTFTFGGTDLVKAVRNYYKEEPNQINRW